MPPKKAKPRPITWTVVGGSLSGGILARQGPETKSAECAERLSTGAVIQELEVQGERMRYKRVSGSGPDTGWISTKFKGKDQLEKRRLKAWIIVTGTRGDIQPYLALAMGMKEAGYDMTIWTCEDYRSFVEGYGIQMRKIAGSTETLIKSTFNKKSKDSDSKNAPKEAKELQEQFAAWNDFSTVGACWSLSIEFGVPVGGISADELLPREVEERYPKGIVIGHYEAVLPHLRPDVAEKYWLRVEELKRELEEEQAAQYASADQGAGEAGTEPQQPADQEGLDSGRYEAEAAPGSAPAGVVDEAAGEANWEAAAERANASQEAGKAWPDPHPPADQEGLDWDALRCQAEADPGSALACIMEEVAGEPNWEEASRVVKSYFDSKTFYQKKDLDQMEATVVGGLDGAFMYDSLMDGSLVDTFASEARRDAPDIVLHNIFWLGFALALEASLGIPSIMLCLQPDGIFFGDPHAPWLSDAQYPMIQQLNPELAQFPTLAEARQHYLPTEDSFDWGHWVQKVVFEELITEPRFGVHPIRDMGPRAFFRRLRERHLVGFLSSIASERFMKFMGEFSTRIVAKNHYTGFWLMDEKLQTGKGSAAMFGGPELMKKMEDFIAAGDPPAYIGWGSCVSQLRGREWMVVFAVAALKKADMRGIIHEGWADLTMGLLQEVLQGDDGLGLIEYARKNVLFVSKAPQVWLFPKCSVLVIHGGVGTLAAAWASGTPLIVCPVWHDQFGNAWLNTMMGASVYCQPIDVASATELANCMRVAVTDPQVRRGAQAVQFSMMTDKGIQVATEHIDNVLLEEVPSGRWKEWWL